MIHSLLCVVILVHAGPDLTVAVPESIYIAEDLLVTAEAYFILDKKSCVLTKIDSEGKVLAETKGRGEAPGQFQVPVSLAVGNGKVFVGDFMKIHVFTEDSLTYIDRFPVFNNVKEMSWYDDELFLSIYEFGKGKHAVYVYSDSGRVLRDFYEHRTDDPDNDFQMPFFDQGSDGTLFLLHPQEYRVDILDRQGKPDRVLPVKVPPTYMEKTSPKAYHKKYGMNLSAYHHWLTSWSSSAGVAVEQNRYLWLCFSQMNDDLRGYTYHVDVYDLETGEKLIQWQEMAGRLYTGGRFAYFIEEIDHGAGYELEIRGYETSR